MQQAVKKHYVICYDILNDRARQRIAKVLLDYGQRVQKSVFELYIKEELFEACMARLAPLIGETDSLRIYQLGF